jgi:hypothetical protein
MNSLALRNASFALVTSLTTLAWGCKTENPDFDPDQLPPGVVCAEGTETRQVVSTLENPSKLDVLFVVSNTARDSSAQRRLALAMPAFVDALRELGIDYQVGVTLGHTVEPTDSGKLVAVNTIAGCEDARRIVTPSTVDGDRILACNVRVGEEGSSLQQPLEAAHDALTIRVNEPAEAGGNGGFVRRDARQLVVFVGYRDDCSHEDAQLASDIPTMTSCRWAGAELTPVSFFAQRLAGLKSTSAGVAIGVIAGDDDGIDLVSPNRAAPTCFDSEETQVFAAPRLIELVSIFEPTSHFESACSASYSKALVRMVDRLVRPGPLTICPQARLAGPPLAVRLVTGGETTELESGGSDGYVYVGATDTCANGAVQISPNALKAGSGGLELDFCGL